MTVSFQTNRLKSRRKINIDGREYIVRQYGNIERMEAMRINDEIKKILSKYPENVPDEDISDVDMDAIRGLAEKASNRLITLFDDGTEDQRYSKELVPTLIEEDIEDIMAVFDTPIAGGIKEVNDGKEEPQS